MISYSHMRRIVTIFFVASCLAPFPAAAGFRVSPVQILLDQSTGSGSVTITNDEERPVAFQVNAVAWTQDEHGRDVYAETGDLLFFPRIMTLEKGGSQVIRVGVKSPSGPRERCFRLYVRGMAPPAENVDAGRVAIELRMGIPVFLQPVRSTILGEVDGLEVAGGLLRVRVRNNGTAHFKAEKLRFSGIDGSGREIFTRDLDGWYLLAGASRGYETPIPEEICPQVSQVRVSVKAGQEAFEGAAAVETGHCSR